MKNILIKKLLSVITASAITASVAVVSVPVFAFDAPAPDSGAVGGILNGGEWSIYASGIGATRNSTAITDAADKGIVEVNGGSGMGAQFQFELSTMMDNIAADSSKVVKSAKLRFTPMVTRSGMKHSLFLINNDFITTEGKSPVTDFEVPRGSQNDFFKEGNIIALTSEGMTEYPDALKIWQTAIDITGETITTGDKISLAVEYSNGTKEKIEYATPNIAANGRLNGGAVPFLYNGGATDYSKWVYPQIVFEYSDSQTYKDAYADFINAYSELSTGIVTEDNSVTLSNTQNGSDITLEMYSDAVSPIRVDGNSLVFDDRYVGDDTSAYVKLNVSKTDSDETARYSRIVAVNADYTKSNTISFDAVKQPKGEVSVVSAGKTYTDGTAYAKTGGEFYVDGGANIGYKADITVRNTGTDEIIPQNIHGAYTMPDGHVSVSVEYSKNTYGTTRIAAVNSASVKSDGNVQGDSASAPNIVIGAGRITFVKFDLSGYNQDIISNAEISFNAWNTGNTKAVFYVPNNEWNENSMSKNFSLDNTSDTSLSGFKYAEGAISLLNGADIGSLIIPDGNDASSAENGILKDYYIGSTGSDKTASFDITDAIKTALDKSADNIITLMIYSSGGGNDANSVLFADSIGARPSLLITESAEKLPDDELVTEITTIEDLENFAKIVNGGNNYNGKTVKLANDIDLSEKYSQTGDSWAAIGIQDIGGIKPFAGTFDGGNHSITGLYINKNDITQGLFGVVTGTIQNLTVTGEINGSSVVGGIAAQCSGTITNCHSRVNIIAQREAGGIAGTLSNGGIISNSDNSGNIKIKNKETYAGGIAGHNIEGVVEECNNSGVIENGSDGFRNRLGGIVGFLDNGEIRYSHNMGDVISNAETASYTADVTQNYVGGIVGYSSYGIITNSGNSGNVRNAEAYAGGIAGSLQVGNIMNNCDNSGNISAKDYAGGIAGCVYSDISDCRNDGFVSGAGKCAGGVAGYLSVGDIHDCSYDEAKNENLKIVGVNSAGTVTFSSDISKDRVEYSNGNAVVSVTKPGTYRLIFAAYDGLGILISTEAQKVTFSAPDEKTFSPTSFKSEGADTVKVMLWRDFDSMEPICEADKKEI